MFCQWFNPLEHLSASSSNSEVNSHPVHGLIHEGTYTFINSISGLICRKLITWCWLNPMFCQWFNPLEHLSATSEVNSRPLHGLIHEDTYTFIDSISGLICRKLITWCWLNPMFCQWFNPLEHLSATSEVNSHPVHGLIHEGTRYKLSRWLICRKLFTWCWFNPMFCQWFNPLEHLSASSSNSEVNSHPVHGLIHEGTYTFINSISGLICRILITWCWPQCSVNGLIH